MENLFSAFIGILSALITSLVTVHIFKRQSWNENVSKERMKWIVEFREEVGELMKAIKLFEHFSSNICEEKCEKKGKEDCGFDCLNIILNGEKARYKLYTRINTSKVEQNEFNFAYKKMLEELKFDSNMLTNTDKNKNLNFDIDAFMKLTNMILELEWQKVKKEAKGKK